MDNSDDVFVFPATLGQQRYWLVDRFRAGSASLNMPIAHRLLGYLDPEALRAAIAEIIRRHESLRTTFEEIDGQLKQVISPPFPVDLPVLDLTPTRNDEREDAAGRAIQEDALVALDVRTGPLIRCRLLKLSETEHILTTNMHHIISDGWSNGVYLRELAAIYAAFSKGQPSPLEELPLQYADYAQWQEDWLNSGGHVAAVEFWRKHLENATPLLELPTDHPRTPGGRSPGQIETLLIPRDLVNVLQNYCQREGMTPYAVYMAVFQVLLCNYSGQETFLVGSPAANRPQAELEGLIGLFANPILARADLSGAPTFRSLVSRVREWTLDSWPHQGLPFEKLLAEVNLEGGQDVTSLLRAYFIYQKAFMEPQQAGELTITPIRSVSAGALFDLMLGIVERAEGPRLQMEYNTALFERETVAGMLSQFCTILEAGLSRPDATVDTLPLLRDEEAGELLRACCGQRSEYDRDLAVHEWFERQVDCKPSSIAAAHEAREIDYRDLNQKANQLARRLIRLGVGKGTLVGIFLERGLDMLVSVLAALKAGAAYVPLDPSHPAERLAEILEETKAHLVLTQERVAARLPSGRPRMVCVDAEQELIGQELSTNLGRTAGGEDLAYVIFTSGSTGRPKGVEISHRSLVNLLEAMRREPGLKDTDRLIAVTTLSFDIAGLELFLPLVCGARVIIAGDKEARDPKALWRLLERSRATVMQATPATWRMLLETGWPGRPHLKMLSGGEALPRELAERLLDTGGELWNLYGPTETTIWSSAARVQRGQGPVPLGGPILNTQFRILNSHQQLRPIGVPGELYIAGDGLARGYFGQPTLTASKFVQDRFSGTTGSRMYRTGDMVRYHSDGRIEFLGRTDDQVKVRGFRIELGEVKAALQDYPAVNEAIVLAHTDGSGEQKLTAWVTVLKGNDPVSITDLRSFLQRKLPDYMLPASIVALDVLPRTPNGKVDTRRLRAMATNTVDNGHLENRGPMVAPRNDTESRLFRNWESVLGFSRFGVTDSFLDLGGSSLQAFSLMAAINKEFQTSFSGPTLFFAVTIEAQAKLITETLARAAQHLVVPIQRGDTSKPPFFMIHSYHLYAALPKGLGSDQRFYGVQEFAAEDRVDDWSLESMMSRYVEAIRAAEPHGPYIIGGFCSAAMPAFEVARQLQDAGESVPLLVIVESLGGGGGEGKTWADRLRSARDVIKVGWRLHTSKLKPLAAWDRLGYLNSLGVRKLRNLGTNAEIWAWRRVCRFYLRRDFQIPTSLRRRLISGIRIITLEAIRGYSPKEYSGDIAVFLATEANFGRDADYVVPWMGLTSGNVRTIWLPGDHASAFAEPNISFFARELRNAINSATEDRQSVSPGKEAYSVSSV
jgi:amino acid adenylation domain-containing protein